MQELRISVSGGHSYRPVVSVVRLMVHWTFHFVKLRTETALTTSEHCKNVDIAGQVAVMHVVSSDTNTIHCGSVMA